MEVFLILIHIVLFSSDNLEPGQELDHKAEAENIQTNYMLFLHRYSNHVIRWNDLINIHPLFQAILK